MVVSLICFGGFCFLMCNHQHAGIEEDKLDIFMLLLIFIYPGTCCVTRSQCQDFTSCHACYAATGTNCSKGLHIEVPFFNLLFVNLPDAVLSRKQQVLITALGGEEEVFHQTAALTRKYTEKLVQDIRNEGE